MTEAAFGDLYAHWEVAIYVYKEQLGRVQMAVGEGGGARHGQTQHPQHHRPCLHLAFVSSILTYGVVICEISNVELRE